MNSYDPYQQIETTMDKVYEKPSVYTVLYWLIQDKKIEPKMVFDFLELFWPTFIQKDHHIFLKERFSEEEYKRLMKDNSNPEYWINLLTIDDFFSELPDWQEQSSFLAQKLVHMWAAKLKNDFPKVNFTVEYLCNEENGDYGLTFYQSEKNCTHEKTENSREIATPNIKESKIEQSSSGPRSGIPKIRKPQPDELPN